MGIIPAMDQRPVSGRRVGGWVPCFMSPRRLKHGATTVKDDPAQPDTVVDQPCLVLSSRSMAPGCAACVLMMLNEMGPDAEPASIEGPKPRVVRTSRARELRPVETACKSRRF